MRYNALKAVLGMVERVDPRLYRKSFPTIEMHRPVVQCIKVILRLLTVLYLVTLREIRD